MEWDLAVFPQPVNRPLAFKQQLDKLQFMFEEIFARNEKLELLAESIYENGQKERKKGASSLLTEAAARQQNLEPTFPFVPKERLRTKSTSLRSPRSVYSVDGDYFRKDNPKLSNAYTALDQDIRQSIDNLARKQEQFNEKIMQVLDLDAEREGRPTAVSQASRPTALSEVGRPTQTEEGRLESTESQQHRDNAATEAGRTTALSQSGDGRARATNVGFIEPTRFEAAQKLESRGSCESLDSAPSVKGRGHSKFAVHTGNTKEYHSGTHRWSMVQEFISTTPSLKSLLEATTFTLVSSVLILSYAVLIAVETTIISNDPDSDSDAIRIAHYVYTGIFCFELFLRFAAYGRSVFSGEDGLWNKLDVFFVTTAIIETVMENAVGSVRTAGNVVRAVRIGRIIRTVRLVRTFHQFHEFQKMAYALMSSMKTLACSMALLIFVMFFFAVWLTQGAADTEKRLKVENLELRYGNLMATTYTLFLSVANGISWDLCYMPLYESSWISAQAFIMYISITMFGVLNVVTSIFVEGVMRSMQRSKDLIVQEKEEEKKIAIVHMKEVFRQLDSDESGQISMDELEHFLSEPNLRKYMDALDIQSEDTRMLFRLLGAAKSIDVHALMYQVRQFLDKWGEFTGYVDDCFAQLRRRLPSEVRESKDKGRMTSSKHSTHSSAHRQVSTMG